MANNLGPVQVATLNVFGDYDGNQVAPGIGEAQVVPDSVINRAIELARESSSNRQAGTSELIGRVTSLEDLVRNLVEQVREIRQENNELRIEIGQKNQLLIDEIRKNLDITRERDQLILDKQAADAAKQAVEAQRDQLILDKQAADNAKQAADNAKQAADAAKLAAIAERDRLQRQLNQANLGNSAIQADKDQIQKELDNLKLENEKLKKSNLDFEKTNKEMKNNADKLSEEKKELSENYKKIERNVTNLTTNVNNIQKKLIELTDLKDENKIIKTFEELAELLNIPDPDKQKMIDNIRTHLKSHGFIDLRSLMFGLGGALVGGAGVAALMNKHTLISMIQDFIRKRIS